MEPNLQQRQRSLIIVWFGLLVSVGLYFALSHFQVSPTPDLTLAKSPLIIALTAMAMVLVIVSFVLKKRFLGQAVEQQNVAQVNVAYIVAWALCEASALLGLIEGLVFGYPGYYWLMLLGAVSIAIQFPRLEQLEAASIRPVNTSSF